MNICNILTKINVIFRFISKILRKYNFPARSFRLKLAQSRKIKPSVRPVFLPPHTRQNSAQNRKQISRAQSDCSFALPGIRNLCLVSPSPRQSGFTISHALTMGFWGTTAKAKWQRSHNSGIMTTLPSRPQRKNPVRLLHK